MIEHKYQSLAQRTSSTKTSAEKVLNGCMGLIGEAGEVVDLAKKLTFQGMPLDKFTERLKGEIGDVLWYCAQLFQGLHVDLHDRMATGDALVVMHAAEFQNMSLVKAAFTLSAYVQEPFFDFVEDYPLSVDDLQERINHVIRIIGMCKYIAATYCSYTLQECMQMNIDKLKARYPEGFDAERSNHRAAGDQ